MLVMVRCTIFDGVREQVTRDSDLVRSAHAREGRVLAAWRAVEGNAGYVVLDVPSAARISVLLRDAFPDARHIDVVEVVMVESVASDNEADLSQTTLSASRATGS